MKAPVKSFWIISKHCIIIVSNDAIEPDIHDHHSDFFFYIADNPVTAFAALTYLVPDAKYKASHEKVLYFAQVCMHGHAKPMHCKLHVFLHVNVGMTGENWKLPGMSCPCISQQWQYSERQPVIYHVYTQTFRLS